jgi:hypothetical protein
MLKKFGNDLNLPKVDPDKLIEMRRKNINTCEQSAQVASEAPAGKQREMTETAFREAAAMAGDFRPTGGPKQFLAKQKIIEEVGTSPESWEKSATSAVNWAAKTLRALRVAQIVQLDMQSFRRRGGSLSREVRALFQVRRLGRRSLDFFGSHQTSCMQRPPL